MSNATCYSQATGEQPTSYAGRTTGEYHRFAYKQWTDEALASAVVLRDEQAYTEICLRHSAALRNATHGILGVNPGSDDIVAEVLSGFWFQPELFDPRRGPLLGYLKLKARGRSIDVFRSQSSRYRRELSDAQANRRTDRGIDARLLAAEVGAELQRAMALLPDREREAIRLAFYDAMSYQAVARHLEIPEGTVKSRIRAGLRHLRGALLVEHGGDAMIALAD